jgi:alpha-L-fucosidase 2
MLMQSQLLTANGKSTTVIELLPALPAAWSEGKVSGLCARGGFEVSFEWKDGKVRDATIKAKKEGTVTLLYNGQQKTLKLKAGQTLPVKTW